jgi:opacity protein-like surface antigen
MKKTFSVFVVLMMLLMLSGVSSGAVAGPYISGNLGETFMNDSDVLVSAGSRDFVTVEYKPGFAGSFAAGYNFGMFRVEGEIAYQSNNADYKYREVDDYDYYYDVNHDAVHYDKSDMKAWSFMGNFYLDFVNSSPVTPFITAGIGMADVELFAVNDDVMAYQVGAGLAFEINPHMSIDIKYRYFATDDLNYGGYDVEFSSHNVYAGFRYTF